MIKSSRERAPRVGDVVCLGDGYSPWMIREHNTPLSAGFMDLWADGQYEIRKEGPLPNAAHDAPVACKAPEWCGKEYRSEDVPADSDFYRDTGANLVFTEKDDGREFWEQSRRAYCTQACADRAAKPANGEGRRLADGWERLPGTTLLQCDGLGFPVPKHEVRKAAYGERLGCGDSYVYNTCACEACAEAAGVFADSKPVAPPPAVKSQAAPPAPWKCPGVAVGDTARACSRPDLPQWKPGHMRCAVCQDGHVAACMAQTEAGRARPVMTFDHVPQPKAPRIRDVYRTDNWRDPDWLPGAEVE